MARRTPGRKDLAALLGCDVPLFSAPMLGSSGPQLACAVARAGGVGMVPCSGMPAGKLDELIGRLSVESGGTVGYNFFCHQLPEGSWDTRSALARPWQQIMAPIYAREGVTTAQVEEAYQRAADTRFNEAQCRVLLQRAQCGEVRLVSFHFGLPQPRLWSALRQVDGLVTMCTATTVKEALFLNRAGVDVIICQGAEAGGHRGTFLDFDAKVAPDPLGLFALLPQVRRAVGPEAYLVAAGGVVDARTAEAACVLGADGVQCGTVFLTAAESTSSALHRRAVESAKRAEDALVTGTTPLDAASPPPRNITNILTGRPARGLVNDVMAEVGCVRPEAPAYPMATPYMAALRAAAEPAGRGAFTQLWAGQNLSGCLGGELSAGELVPRIAAGLQRPTKGTAQGHKT